MKRFSKEECVEGLAFLFVFLIGMCLFYHAGFTSSGDDEVYRTAIMTWGSWHDWAAAYYNEWSGRLILHSILIALTNMPVFVWKIISAFMMAGTCWMISRMADLSADGMKRAGLLMLTLELWRMIPDLYNPVIWAAGSVNYLYPVAMLMIGLYLFYRVLTQEELNIVWKVCGCAACAICGNMEQSAAVLFVIGILFFVYVRVFWKEEIWESRRKDIIFLFVLWCINAGVMLLSYLAPGNERRFSMELFRCVGYGMMSYADRALLGLQRFILDISAYQGFLLWMIPAGICALFALMERNAKQFMTVGIYIALSCLQNVIVRKVLDIQFVYPFDTAYLLWLLFSVCLLFYNGGIVITAMNTHRDKFWFAFLYYGAIAASVVSGFSPTVFISAKRTVYITYVLLNLITVKCLSNGLSPKKLDEKKLFSMERLNACLGMVVAVVLVGGFVLSNHRIDHISTTDMEADVSLIGMDAKIDRENKTITAVVDVSRFAYDVDNWCTDEEDGVDINLAMGILNDDTGEMKLYKTCLNTEWPIMDSFPENQVEAVAYLWEGADLLPNESYVLVATDHEGNMTYNTLEMPESK